jgi:hypothetical protein
MQPTPRPAQEKLQRIRTQVQDMFHRLEDQPQQAILDQLEQRGNSRDAF